jgi:hypothetical protein
MGLFDRLLGRGTRQSPEPVGGSEFAVSIEQARNLMEDDNSQDYLPYPELVKRRMAMGGAIDELPEGIGEFGRSAGNPIPVNGPLGELTYLSKLVGGRGLHIIAHRLGACAGGDAYEAVSLDGLDWDLLYLDPYHTRRSRVVPSRYQADARCDLFLFATNYFWPTFPVGIAGALRSCSDRLFGLTLVSDSLPGDEFLRTLSRPDAHAAALASLRTVARTTHGP